MSLEPVTDSRPEADVHRSEGHFGNSVDIPSELDAHRNGLDGGLDIRPADTGKGALLSREAAQDTDAQPDAGIHVEYLGTDIGKADVRQQIEGGSGNPAVTVHGIRPEVRSGQLHAHGEPSPELEGYLTRQKTQAMDLIALVSGSIGG